MCSETAYQAPPTPNPQPKMIRNSNPDFMIDADSGVRQIAAKSPC